MASILTREKRMRLILQQTKQPANPACFAVQMEESRANLIELRLHVYSHHRYNFINYGAYPSHIAICGANIPLQLVDCDRRCASWMDQRFCVANTNALCLAIPCLAASFALFSISYICRRRDRVGVCNQPYYIVSRDHHHSSGPQ